MHKFAAAVLCSWVFSLSAHPVSKYPYIPDPKLTPGMAASTNKALICERDYARSSRRVTPSMRKKVYLAHGVDTAQCAGGCKIDHLIPLGIGGSNDPLNLWPHEYGAHWGVFKKTRLEILLRKEVCTGKLPLKEAQTCIQSNWVRCYQRFYQ